MEASFHRRCLTSTCSARVHRRSTTKAEGRDILEALLLGALNSGAGRLPLLDQPGRSDV